MTHDPLCLMAVPYTWRDPRCECDLIASVRADERTTLTSARYLEGVNAAIRAQIAADIVAARDRLMADGYSTENFDYCADIVRGVR